MLWASRKLVLRSWACISNTLRIKFSPARRRRRNSKQLVFIVVYCAAQLEQRSRLLMTTAPSCTLGDFFGARSCGAPFSGMNMDTNWSKSARATTHPPRTARAWCRIIQLTTNWHAFPVLPPLHDTEIEKKHHHYTAFRSLFTFSPKIRGTNPNTRYAKKKQGMMGVGNLNF